MAYPNLAAEMKRLNITQKDLAQRIGRTPETVGHWIRGDFPASISDAFKVKDEFFPTMTVDYLFSNEPFIPTN